MSDLPRQGFLFDSPQPAIPCWRRLPEPRWLDAQHDLEELLELHLELLRRDRELFEALRAAEVCGAVPALEQFRATESMLLVNAALLVNGRIEELEIPGILDATRKVVDELAGWRQQILAGVDPGRRRSVLAAEARARVGKAEVLLDLAPVGHQLAAEADEQSLELPLAPPD